MVDFQTVAVGLPSGPNPPATTIPSVTATTAAPDRASGNVTATASLSSAAPFLTTVHWPSALVSGSIAIDQSVFVALPSGPTPPMR